jgi:hypothetical protein
MWSEMTELQQFGATMTGIFVAVFTYLAVHVARQYKGSSTSDVRTHDYTAGRRGWGHDYVFTPGKDGGYTAFMQGWGTGISKGDYLLISTNHRDPKGPTSRYRVDWIEYHRDPHDMWQARVKLAPRATCRRCGNSVSSDGALYCGAACSTQAEQEHHGVSHV